MSEYFDRKAARRHSERQRIRVKRSWDSGERHAAIIRRGVDADTLRLRALEDRRGTVVIDAGAVVVLWSMLGRTDQMDIFEDGRKVFTGSAHRCMDELVKMSMNKQEVRIGL